MTALRSSESLGRALRDARTARGWTQGALATRAGVSQPTISNLERGAGDASLTTLWRVLAALELQLTLMPRGKVSARSAWDPEG